jgi:hypothetical protein
MTPLDPVVAEILALGLALLFLGASLHKLRDPRSFRAALAGYELVPRRLLGPVAFALVLAEALAGAGALLPGLRRLALGLVLALLAAYTLAIAANLARGRRGIDCGCAGPAARQPLSLGLVLRNLALALAAAAGLAPVAGRELVWLDWGTIALGAAAAAGLYLACERLLANHALLRGLRA